LYLFNRTIQYSIFSIQKSVIAYNLSTRFRIVALWYYLIVTTSTTALHTVINSGIYRFTMQLVCTISSSNLQTVPDSSYWECDRSLQYSQLLLKPYINNVKAYYNVNISLFWYIKYYFFYPIARFLEWNERKFVFYTDIIQVVLSNIFTVVLFQMEQFIIVMNFAKRYVTPYHGIILYPFETT